MHAACKSFVVNEPTKQLHSKRRRTGGVAGCMSHDGRERTIFDHVVRYQQMLMQKMLPFADVTHIDTFEEAVVFEKRPREDAD